MDVPQCVDSPESVLYNPQTTLVSAREEVKDEKIWLAEYRGVRAEEGSRRATESLPEQYSGERWRDAEYGEPSTAGGISPLPFRSKRIILPSWKCDISGSEVGAGWTWWTRVCGAYFGQVRYVPFFKATGRHDHLTGARIWAKWKQMTLK